jgi:Leu/Phe-tRNA-protein transferase
MIVLRDEQAIVVHRLLTSMLLNETYRLSDVEDALIWVAPENRQILCPFDALWSRNLAQEIVRELRQSQEGV